MDASSMYTKTKHKQQKSTFSQSFSVNLLWSRVLCWDLRFLSMEAIIEQTCSGKENRVDASSMYTRHMQIHLLLYIH